MSHFSHFCKLLSLKKIDYISEGMEVVGTEGGGAKDMFWLWLALNYLTHMQLTARYEGKGGGVLPPRAA